MSGQTSQAARSSFRYLLQTPAANEQTADGQIGSADSSPVQERFYILAVVKQVDNEDGSYHFEIVDLLHPNQQHGYDEQHLMTWAEMQVALQHSGPGTGILPSDSRTVLRVGKAVRKWQRSQHRLFDRVDADMPVQTMHPRILSAQQLSHDQSGNTQPANTQNNATFWIVKGIKGVDEEQVAAGRQSSGQVSVAIVGSDKDERAANNMRAYESYCNQVGWPAKIIWLKNPDACDNYQFFGNRLREFRIEHKDGPLVVLIHGHGVVSKERLMIDAQLSYPGVRNDRRNRVRVVGACRILEYLRYHMSGDDILLLVHTDRAEEILQVGRRSGAGALHVICAPGSDLNGDEKAQAGIFVDFLALFKRFHDRATIKNKRLTSEHLFEKIFAEYAARREKSSAEEAMDQPEFANLSSKANKRREIVLYTPRLEEDLDHNGSEPGEGQEELC